MKQKNYTCPHCQQVCLVNVDTFSEKLKKELPGGILKGIAVTVATAVATPAGLVAGGLLVADGVKKYINGTSVTCPYEGCREQFKL